MNRPSDPFGYDLQKRAGAGTRATLRSCVCLYLGYLGFQLIRNADSAESTMSPQLAWVFGLLLLAAAIGFGVYVIFRYRADLEAARLPAEERTEEDSHGSL